MISMGVLGSSAQFTRRFRAGATFKTGQIVCAGGISTTIAQLKAPASTTDYSKAVGIILDAVPPTYSTTQGTGSSSASVACESTYHPMQLYKGRVSGVTASWGAIVAAAGGPLLTNTTASSTGVLVTDATYTGTTVTVGAALVGLTGNNAGYVREVTSGVASTSQTVTVPFDYAIAVGDTFLRTFNIFMEGIILTTDCKDFLPTANGATMPDQDATGTIVYDVLIDGSTVSPKGGYPSKGIQNVNITNPTAPLVEIIGLFSDPVFNRQS